MNKNFKIGGSFEYTLIRGGEVIDSWVEDNIIVDEGLNYALGASFGAASPVTTWYVGLYKNNYTPIATNVMATFTGAGVASESITEYSNVTRPAWVPAAVAAKTITNSASPATFNISSGVTINGSFLSSSNAKGSNGGVLSAASKFATSRILQVDDVLNIIYTLQISST